jgi:hypothetical protein
MRIPLIQFAKGTGVTLLTDGKYSRVLVRSGEVPGDVAAKQKEKGQNYQGQRRRAKKSGHVLIRPEMRGKVTGRGEVK